jgi:geranylgeranyl reductase family protein
MTWDVVVAGAGPVGSAAARACAEAGLATLCLEEHGTIGYPVQCAGLLSLAAFDECRVSRRPVTNTVTGARIITGSGSELSIDARVPKAHVVDRGILDREMAAAAADAGAVFRLKTQVYGVQGTRVLTRGINGHEEHPFRLLIAADGPRSTIARALGMERAKLYLAGIQGEGAYNCDPGLVELYPNASPEFFGWVIPAGDGRVRAGLCGKMKVKERFLSFVRTLGMRSDLHLVTGTLPLGIMPRTYGHRTLFTGDAAGFAKPTSGGGVYTGVRTARHAAEVVISCCEHERFSDHALSAYEERWQADIGRELALGFRFFLMRQEMSPATIEGLIRGLSEPAIHDAIVQHGDMDRPAALVRLLIKNPALLRWFSPLIVSGVRSYFNE